MLEAIRTSFFASFGDIVFGMEDGTVSIFGLVFGMADLAPFSESRSGEIPLEPDWQR